MQVHLNARVRDPLPFVGGPQTWFCAFATSENSGYYTLSCKSGTPKRGESSVLSLPTLRGHHEDPLELYPGKHSQRRKRPVGSG